MIPLEKYKLFSLSECQDIINYINESTQNWFRTFKPTVFTSTLDSTTWFNLRIRDWISTQLDLTTEKYNAGFSTTCFKYYKGGGFEEHTDQVGEWDSYPIYNINIILNNDFSDGNFFLNKIIHETNPGYIYKYKSNEKHGVKTVTDGIRYMLVCHVFDSDLVKSQKTLL